MKPPATIKYAFFLVGVGFLIAAIALFVNKRTYLKDAISTEGTVTELIRTRSRSKSSSSTSTTYRPVVEFKTKDGSIVEFTSSTGSNPPSYSRGESVGIYYDEEFPERATIDDFTSLWGATTLFGFFGSMFFLIGFIPTLIGRSLNKQVGYLIENGVAIKADFQMVKRNKALTVNNRHPYKIYAQWMNPATSKVHVFSSENIWFDPTAYIESDELTVLIEADNPKKYHVDVSFLPRMAS